MLRDDRVSRFDQSTSRHSSSIVVVELESRSLRIILILEKALEATTALERLRSATCVSRVPQNGVEVGIGMCLLRVTLFHMLMRGEVLSSKMRAQVVQLLTGSLSAHRKPVLKGVSSDLSVNRVTPLESRSWLAHHSLHPSIITTGR